MDSLTLTRKTGSPIKMNWRKILYIVFANRIVNTIMDWSYILKHWGCTLILAPILSQIVKEIGCGNPNEVMGLFEIFPLTMAASTALSLPTLLIYLFIFHITERSGTRTLWIKLILIAWTICGISLTLYLLGGSIIPQISVYYIIASLICGILIKMKRKQVEPNVV